MLKRLQLLNRTNTFLNRLFCIPRKKLSLPPEFKPSQKLHLPRPFPPPPNLLPSTLEKKKRKKKKKKKEEEEEEEKRRSVLQKDVSDSEGFSCIYEPANNIHAF